MKVLITSGATREPIDSVRYISNFSTGKTGAAIADYLTQAGIDVVFFAGLGSARPHHPVKLIEYSSFRNLDEILKAELSSQDFDGVIHAAAVSDYSVENSAKGKLSSDTETLHLQLSRNFKIVERLKGYSRCPDRTLIIAFKLTDTPNPEAQLKAIQKLSLHSKIDWVVHNDLSEISENLQHHFSIFSKNQKISEGQTKVELAKTLLKLIQEKKYL